MKRVLIIGNSPLPNDNAKKRPSEGLRTWQFIKSFETLEGYDLRTVTVSISDCYDEDQNNSQIGVSSPEASRASAQTSAQAGAQAKAGGRSGLGGRIQGQHYEICENDPAIRGKLQAVIDEFAPHVIIGVNLDVCHLISKLKFDCVFWADMAGWTMAKAQIDAYKTGNDRKLGAYLKVEEDVLERADFVSVASEAQKFVVLGELAMMKKLGAYEFDREFVVVIENGLEDFESDRIEKIFRTVRHAPSLDRAWSAGTFEQVEDTGLRYFRGSDSFSGADVPANAFVILWLGSYSAWVDEETLFKGVEAAMESVEGSFAEEDSGHAGREPRRIYFLSTGGLSEHNLSNGASGGAGGAETGVESSNGANKTYLNFKEMVGLSRFKDRFKFLGWVPVKHIPYLYSEADIGLNVDRRCLDTLTGSRNRLLEMMKFEMPVVTTLGTELSYGMQSFGACIGVRSGSVEGVRDAILELYSNPARRKDYGMKGRKFVEQYYSYARVMRPFVKWIDKFIVPLSDRPGDFNKTSSAGSGKIAEKAAENVAKGIARGFKSAKSWLGK